MPRMGRRDEALAVDAKKEVEEVLVAQRIELRAHVIEQEERRVPVRVDENLHLRRLPRKDCRPQLPLGREYARVVSVEEKQEIVGVRAGAGVAACEIPAARRADLVEERALPLARGVVGAGGRHTRLRDGVERRNQVRGDLVEIAPPGRHDPLAVVSELLVVHVEELAAGAAAAEKGIALVEDARKTLRV